VATTGILGIPKGLQALAVTIPSNADVAGFVQNGSAVAIYLTSKIKLPTSSTNTQSITAGTDLEVTKLLLPRVSVIAVSQDAPSDLHGGGSTSSNNILVTLAVSQQDAQRIINGQTVGSLYLTLLTDSSVTADDPGILNVGKFNPAPIFVK